MPQITSGRFIIFTKLGHRGLPEHRAQEHTEPFDVSAPAITKHLRVLESAGLIERRKEGRVNYCCLSEDGLEDASDWIQQQRAFWEQQLDVLEKYLEKEKGAACDRAVY